MRLAARNVFFIFCAVMLTTSPGFGLSDGSCQACKTTTTTDATWYFCGSPEDGDWGATECKVTCYQFGNTGACSCTTSGGGCLNIVVQG